MSKPVGRNNAKIITRNQGGGNKLQGLAPTSTSFSIPKSTGSSYYTESGDGRNRNLVICVNQLGGVGRGRSQFRGNADGKRGDGCDSGSHYTGPINPPSDAIFITTIHDFQNYVKPTMTTTPPLILTSTFLSDTSIFPDSVASIDDEINVIFSNFNSNYIYTFNKSIGGGSDFSVNILNLSLNNYPGVSKFTSMNAMFNECIHFNQDINNWDVGSVTSMISLFGGCEKFNKPLNSWDVSSVTNMNSMFYGCRDFNKPLNSWNVSSVTNMAGMFVDSSFNQDISNWNVSSVTDMEYMFYGCSNFNKNISNWNVSSVTNMNGMFDECDSLTRSNARAIWNSWRVQLDRQVAVIPKNQLYNSLQSKLNLE